MTDKPEKFVRRTFEVTAWQVTEDNIEDVREWCMGDIRRNDVGIPYIHVRVHHPRNARDTRAFSGDWVVYADNGYKVYPHRSFEFSFEKKPAEA